MHKAMPAPDSMNNLLLPANSMVANGIVAQIALKVNTLAANILERLEDKPIVAKSWLE
jgi:hypothetical protein